MFSSLRTTLKVLAAAALLFAGTALFVPQGPARADTIDDQVTAMKDAAKAKDSGKCIAQMVLLQDSLDARVAKALTALVKNRDPKIAGAAIRQLGLRKDKAFGKRVGKAIGNKKLYKVDDEEDAEVYLAYLDAAAMYANPKHGKELIGIVKKFIATNTDYSTRAIKAYGSVQDKEVIDQLIKWLVQTESRGVSQGGKRQSTETRDNKAKSGKAVVAALEALTGQSIGDGAAWQEFWKTERKGFDFPEADAEPVDPATLSEWTDGPYGYTIKKPTHDETWTFTDPGSEYIRMRLESRDPKDELVMARAEFSIHNLSTQSPKTVKDLAKWYLEKFSEERFSQTSKDPVIEEKKIGGRDFVVISGRGDAGSYHSGWGTIELRVYLTKVGHVCIRMEGLTRLGATDETQAALWEALESATWSKNKKKKR